MMNALKFDKRISIVKEKVNDGPLPGTTIQTIANLWADIKTMKGSEYNNFAIGGNIGVSRFIVRYTTIIKPLMKINYKGNLYSIESITNDDENNRTITIIGKAILQGGE